MSQPNNTAPPPRIVVCVRPDSVANAVADGLGQAGAEAVVASSAATALRDIKQHGGKAIVITLADTSLSGDMLALRELGLPVYGVYAESQSPDQRLLQRARRFGIKESLLITSAHERWPAIVRELQASSGRIGEPSWLRGIGTTPPIGGMELVEIDSEEGDPDFTTAWKPDSAPAIARPERRHVVQPPDARVLAPAQFMRLSTEELEAFVASEHSASPTQDARMTAPDSMESLADVETRLRADLERMVEVMVRERTAASLRGSTGVMSLVRSVVEEYARKTEQRLGQQVHRATQNWEIRVHEIASAVAADMREDGRAETLRLVGGIRAELHRSGRSVPDADPAPPQAQSPQNPVPARRAEPGAQPRWVQGAQWTAYALLIASTAIGLFFVVFVVVSRMLAM
jgi:hypothetical protein